MIPGSVSKLSESTVASAATIRVRTDIVRLTGTTGVNNIISSLGSNQGVLLILIPTDGSVILGTTGNILVGQTAVINRALFLVFVKSLNKWVMSSGV